jgi:hypothetical protein
MRCGAVSTRLEAWLGDPFLGRLYRAIRAAGPLRSIALDLTDVCNLRCAGCYFFAEGMEAAAPSSDNASLEAFVARETARGTNFVTVVGGEPSLALDALKKLHDSFHLSVATNGLRRIPRDGFERLSIGVSVWGDQATDRELRGGGKLDVFERALENYAGDERAFWYYTVAPGHAGEVERVVDRCVAGGNRVLFNFYGDVEGRGGELDHRAGFADVRAAIDAAIDRHPDWVLMTSRLAEVVSTGELFDERWGHDVCTSLTPEHPANLERVTNGKPYNAHFRAYNADLASTRRCCTGVDRECSSCFDTWQHFSWVMLNLKKHLASKRDFTAWLSTTYLFYFINGLVDAEEGAALLPELHRRTRESRLALSATHG